MQNLNTQSELHSIILGKRQFTQIAHDLLETEQPTYMKASKSMESTGSVSTDCSDSETSHQHINLISKRSTKQINQNINYKTNQGFNEILAKSQQLASIFKGQVKNTDSFSISKGNNSIRFSCQNEHSFFLQADVIQKIDISKIKRAYKQSRIDLERIHEGSEASGSSEDTSLEAGCERKPLVNLDIDPSCWCPHCFGYFQHCLEEYNTEKFQFIGGLFTKYILYRCTSKGHMFPVKSLRKQKFHKQYKVDAYKCHECGKQQKLEDKQRHAEEQEQHRHAMAEHQRILFEKIRAEEQQNERLNDTNTDNKQQNETNKSHTSHLYQEEQLINQRAQQLANQFLKAIASLQDENVTSDGQLSIIRQVGMTVNSDTLEYLVSKLGDLQFDQVFLVHKLVETPLSVIVSGLRNKSGEEIRTYYKQVAKLIHPDKNVHPMSKDAFQKLRAAVDQCK